MGGHKNAFLKKFYLYLVCCLSPFQDHPSVGQLSDKLLENHMYSIFAVEKQQYQWYEVISPTQVQTTKCIHEKTNVFKVWRLP